MGMKARANVATFFKYFVLILMGFIMVYPLLWMVGSTFKTNAEIFTSLSPFTAHPTLDGYYNAVTKTYGGDITIWRAFLNTYSYVIPKVVFTVISSVIAAYGFSRFKFKGRDFLFGVMIMTLFLPQVVLNVPQYMMYNKFDWINNPLYPALWVPSLFATESAGNPAIVPGTAYRDALSKAAAQPFRMVPYFDPGVWGGDWMKTHFDLPENGSNYAWSFDGVPEENSLLLDFGSCVVETPALNLVYAHPRELLGDCVHARFGKEFPIRFDMLDTMHGQNLSLQVHPLTEYIQSHFHMHYTQDESYYLLDAAGEAPCVYLGIKAGTKPEEMIDALQTAQNGGKPFPAEKFVNKIPVKKHDHVLIPAGTVHCSGADTMVLEISATPYIFTFKLWDWGRVDLDGKPRPIHLEHGAANIQWYRNTEWVHRNLVNAVAEVYTGENGTVVRTGLHEREFLDTFRFTTSSTLPVHRNVSVHMLNLVDGTRAVLRSKSDAFPPLELHYAETCIVPQAAGDYEISSPDGSEVKVILACVRN